MSHKPLLKVKLQHVDEKSDVKASINYMVKTLNSSVQDRSLSDLGNSFIIPYSYAAGPNAEPIRISHGLGVTPNGFMLLYNKPAYTYVYDTFFFNLVSMDNNEIVIYAIANVSTAITGEFKFLILR
jgi:hypothetical protein